MDRAEYERTGVRRRGLRRVRGATAWVASGAAALAIMFGGVFAARGLTGTAAGSTGTTNQPNSSTGTGGSSADDGSGSTDDGSGSTTQQDRNGIQPPAQVPGWSSGSSGSQAQSGGS